jgi:protein involved in polysaccharide export with SLBB domain
MYMKTIFALLGLICTLAVPQSAMNAQSASVPKGQAPNVPQGQAPNVPQGQTPNVPQAQAPTVPENYILSPSDIILVNVFGEPDLDSQHRISQDGTINFPLIGLVKVSGQNVAQAASAIRGRLMKGYLRNPQVRVNVLQYAKRYFTVLGQVGRPGSYVLPDEEHIDLLQAIAMAGGFTRLANEGKVLVRRTVNGTESIIEVNANSQTKKTSAQLFEVQPDDKITVRERIF